MRICEERVTKRGGERGRQAASGSHGTERRGVIWLVDRDKTAQAIQRQKDRSGVVSVHIQATHPLAAAAGLPVPPEHRRMTPSDSTAPPVCHVPHSNP